MHNMAANFISVTMTNVGETKSKHNELMGIIGLCRHLPDRHAIELLNELHSGHDIQQFSKSTIPRNQLTNFSIMSDALIHVRMYGRSQSRYSLRLMHQCSFLVHYSLQQSSVHIIGGG